MKSCTNSSAGFATGPIAAQDPAAGASVEFFVTPGDPTTVLIATLPASPDPTTTFAATIPISSFANAGKPGLKAGPDNALFSYLGSGILQYTGPTGLFLIQGGVTIIAPDVVAVDIVLNHVPLIGTGTASGGIATPETIVAGAVRRLKAGDLIELGLRGGGATETAVEVLSLEMTVIAVGRP